MSKLTKTEAIEKIKAEILNVNSKGKKARNVRFLASALGSIPWVGGFIAASAALHSEFEQGKINDLQKLWLEEHTKKIDELAFTIYQIFERIDAVGEDINERLESEEYLGIVREGFKEWDSAKTFEKKEYIRKLITNAGANNITTDDIIQLFIDWIGRYHELHFAVIKEIYKNPGVTRGDIWHTFNETRPEENSMEADLYKLMFRDLSTGGIIRQVRATDYYGNFLKQPRTRRKTNTLTSAFDDGKDYELTELGKQFVHFTMEEVVTKLN
ncbi:hypothetical protein GCM10022271_26640 [Corallibacter vietnamensis]|uniref:DUF4393 domain-containing protein n=1 Tax=Corallibacter vietnamensis TaxID=904130 RepID=A0ABP7HI43_9FLAO